jgi:hypothetical protein
LQAIRSIPSPPQHHEQAQPCAELRLTDNSQEGLPRLLRIRHRPHAMAQPGKIADDLVSIR